MPLTMSMTASAVIASNAQAVDFRAQWPCFDVSACLRRRHQFHDSIYRFHDMFTDSTTLIAATNGSFHPLDVV
jgi:hypothetical protein